MTSEGKCGDGNSHVQVDIYDGEHLTEPVVRVRSTSTDTVMQVHIAEWIRFVREVRLGDWDHVETDYEILIARAEQAKILNTIEIDANQPVAGAPGDVRSP